MAGTVSLSEFHVRSVVVIVVDILSRLLLTAACGIVPRKADFVSAVLTVDQTAEPLLLRLPCDTDCSISRTLSQSFLRNNSFVRILHNDHVFIVIFDDLVIFVADSSCAELNKMSEVGVIVKYLLDCFTAPHMPCTARIRFAKLCVVVI